MPGRCPANAPLRPPNSKIVYASSRSCRARRQRPRCRQERRCRCIGRRGARRIELHQIDRARLEREIAGHGHRRAGRAGRTWRKSTAAVDVRVADRARTGSGHPLRWTRADDKSPLTSSVPLCTVHGLDWPKVPVTVQVPLPTSLKVVKPTYCRGKPPIVPRSNVPLPLPPSCSVSLQRQRRRRLSRTLAQA